MGDEINIKKLADVVKETKFGQGIDFMPRKTTVLLDNLRELLLQFTERWDSKRLRFATTNVFNLIL